MHIQTNILVSHRAFPPLWVQSLQATPNYHREGAPFHIALSTLVTLGIGLSHSPPQIISLRVLLAVTQAASVPAAAGLIAELHASKTRSTAMGIYLTSPFAGLLVSGVVGGYLAGVRHKSYSWRVFFFCVIFLSVY